MFWNLDPAVLAVIQAPATGAQQTLPNYWWALLSATFGFLSGIRSVFERYPNDARFAFKHPGSWLFVVLRGVVAAVVFTVVVHFEVFEGWKIAQSLPWTAIVVGASAEATLRSKFHIGQSSKNSEEQYQIEAGPYNLLQFFQDLLLGWPSSRVSEIRRKRLRQYIPADVSAEAMVRTVRSRAGSIERDDIRRGIVEVLDAVEPKLDQWRDAGHAEDEIKELIAWELYDVGGLAPLSTLFAN